MDFNIIQGQCALTNSGDVYSGTLSIGVTAYRDKGLYLCKISASNTTTTPTLNLNSIGAKTIVLNNGSALSASTLLIDSWCLFMYDSGSDKFLLINNNAGSTGGSLPYTSYVARLTSVGTANPTATVTYNNTGKTITWTWDATGQYKGLFDVAFADASKIKIFTQLLSSSDGVFISIEWSFLPTYVLVLQYDAALSNVNNLDIYFELRYYN